MNIQSGEVYEFIKHGRFKYPFHAEVEKVNDNSVMAKIIATQVEDDPIIQSCDGRMIISKKYISKKLKNQKVEEKNTMKFNLNTATLLLPGASGFGGKECITISKSGVALSGPIVQRLNKPEWVQLYLDEVNKTMVVLPCKATDEGARNCVNPKKKPKSGYRKNWTGSILEKVAETAGMDIANYLYHVEPEEIEGYPNAVGFDLTKAIKV